MFSDRPPPVPPASVPEAPSRTRDESGAAVRSGFSSRVCRPATDSTQPSIAAVPPVVPPPGASTAGQAVLSLTARYGKDLPVINNGLVWRVFADKPDETGIFKLIREERGATPNIVLPPGGYVVHVAIGLVSAVRPVTPEVRDRPRILRASGGRPAHRGPRRHQPRFRRTRFPSRSTRAASSRIGDRASLVPNVAAGDVALLPEGTYYIISNYGDANSVVRSDIRVQAGKLTDVVITHRAAVITLKLVSDKGGEALANTAWSVITPGGDVIKELIGAFPRVVLSEGEYRAIAKNEGKVFERPFNVVNGVDGEVEVVAR